ncbi:MAG: hypothetical protein ACPG32_16190 [Akkermansiaceae bacterium]
MSPLLEELSGYAGRDWSIALKREASHNHLCNLTYNMDRYALLAG